VELGKEVFNDLIESIARMVGRETPREERVSRRGAVVAFAIPI
jgi:hypothetical protein